MKCFYEIEETGWVKGDVTSLDGGTTVHFQTWNEEANTFENICILYHRPEIIFTSRGFIVTGFTRVDPLAYKLISVEVRFSPPSS